jgi:hypothetical protein
MYEFAGSKSAKLVVQKNEELPSYQEASSLLREHLAPQRLIFI